MKKLSISTIVMLVWCLLLSPMILAFGFSGYDPVHAGQVVYTYLVGVWGGNLVTRTWEWDRCRKP